MKTRWMETEWGSEHKRFLEQLGEITAEVYPTDDPDDAVFSLFGVAYMIDDDSPEITQKVEELLNDWEFVRRRGRGRKFFNNKTGQ